jgi:hypothetical protein
LCTIRPSRRCATLHCGQLMASEQKQPVLSMATSSVPPRDRNRLRR